MAAQTYVSATNVIATATTSVVTTYPVEQGGGALTWGSGVGITGSSGTSGAPIAYFTNGIGANELNYKNRIATSSPVQTDGIDLYQELTNFVSLLCRVQTAVASTCGLHGVTLSSAGTAASGSGTTYTPVFSMTPRTVLFRLQQMITSMLANPNV